MASKSDDSLSAEDLGIIAAVIVLIGDLVALYSLLKAKQEKK
ncbi:hypothetical protein [Brevibacillus laterosporus]|nr:hypothetical protein [Brevibacillus laterosporus]MDN9010854.1 hypothetical protein [Brevibacillus laterosporus]MDO0941877.1 hypothetical protein [Brevibacillus laterosporus]